MTEREQKPTYIDGVRITEACMLQCRCVDNTVIACDRTHALFYHQHRLQSRCDFVTLFATVVRAVA